MAKRKKAKKIKKRKKAKRLKRLKRIKKAKSARSRAPSGRKAKRAKKAKRKVTKVADQIAKLLSLGKERGYLTYEQVNEALPENITSSEEIEQILDALGEAQIELVDAEDAALEKQRGGAAPVAVAGRPTAPSKTPWADRPSLWICQP